MTELASTYTSFQLSTIGVGAIATGVSDIRQCIDFILRTIPGSDPLRPLFGSDVYKYIDAPANTMIPNVKKEIFEAIDLWEPRIEVVSITHEITLGQVLFNITYKVLDSTILDVLTWSGNGVLESDNSNSGLIISAVIPGKVEFGRYYINFLVDAAAAYPAAPEYGFATSADMLAWVTLNWFSYGKWYLTENKIVLFLKNGIVKKASIVVSEVANITLRVTLPSLSSGQFYNLAFSVESNPAQPVFPTDSISSIEQLFLWVGNNWNEYGAWAVERNGAVIVFGDFSDDFDNHDFNIGGVITEQYLIFQTTKYLTASLTFI